MIRILAGFALLQTIGGVSRAASDPLESWTWRNPLPQGNPLYAVTHGNETYVAVGPNGTIVSSTDGYIWLSQSPGTGANAALSAATYGNGLFVAVGPDGSILTSPDGKSWTDRSLNPFHHLNTVAYGNHGFAALGQQTLESNVNIVTSEDGVSWIAGTIASTKPFTGVTFADGLFVVVGSDPWGNGNIATSPDGANWSTRDTAGLNSVAHGNGRFVAVGGTNVLISTNGSDWIPQTVPGARNAITSGNGFFVATEFPFESSQRMA